MARLYPIIEPRAVFDGSGVVDRILAAGIPYLQLRGGTESEVIKSVERLLPLCAERKIDLIINNDARLARRLGCGVHVGQSDMPLGQAREILGPSGVVGISTHRESEWAGADDADYVSVGPIYPTSSKADAEPVVGIELLSRARRWFDDRGQPEKKLVAIGGITPDNAADCLEAGASLVASISGVRTARDLDAMLEAVS